MYCGEQVGKLIFLCRKKRPATGLPYLMKNNPSSLLVVPLGNNGILPVKTEGGQMAVNYCKAR